MRKKHTCKYNLFQAYSYIFTTFRPSPTPSLCERLEQATVTKDIRLYQFTSSIISTQITVNTYSVPCVVLTINLYPEQYPVKQTDDNRKFDLDDTRHGCTLLTCVLKIAIVEGHARVRRVSHPARDLKSLAIVKWSFLASWEA